MINAVIELGDRRLHEVMVPRIEIVALPADGDLRARRSTRSSTRATAAIPVFEESIDEIVGILYAKDLLPFLKTAPGRGRRSARSCGRRSSSPESMTIDDLLHEFQRREGPHRDRPRRVRRDGRARHDRGPARGDRGRDPGRVRRRGADGRPPVGRRGPDRRAGRGRRPGRAVRHATRARGRGRVRHGRRADLPPDRRVPGARRPGRGRRPAPDGRVDRRPPRRQGPRRSASAAATTPTTRPTASPPRPTRTAFEH